MTRQDMVEAVTEMMERVWGPEGLTGDDEEYQWLTATCGITEGDDARWQTISEHANGETNFDLDDADEKFLPDDKAVIQFLDGLLKKYRALPSAYPRQYPVGSINQTRAKLHAHCYRHGSALIEAYVLADDDSCVVMGFDQFLRAVSVERPKAVYWAEEQFDVDDFIEAELLELGWKPGYEDRPDSIWLGPRQIKEKLASRLQQLSVHIGTAYEMVATFAGSGVCCMTNRIRADWAAGLEAAITELVESRKNYAEISMELSDSEDAEQLQILVSELMASDLFRKTRGLNKRLLVATKLLGDRVPKHRRGGILKIAQNGSYCDANLVIVVKTADENLWAENNLPTAK